MGTCHVAQISFPALRSHQVSLWTGIMQASRTVTANTNPTPRLSEETLGITRIKAAAPGSLNLDLRPIRAVSPEFPACRLPGMVIGTSGPSGTVSNEILGISVSVGEGLC